MVIISFLQFAAYHQMFEDKKIMIFHKFDQFPRSFMAKTGLFKNPIHLINVVAQYFLSNRDLHSQYQNTQGFVKSFFSSKWEDKKGFVTMFRFKYLV